MKMKLRKSTQYYLGALAVVLLAVAVFALVPPYVVSRKYRGMWQHRALCGAVRENGLKTNEPGDLAILPNGTTVSFRIVSKRSNGSEWGFREVTEIIESREITLYLKVIEHKEKGVAVIFLEAPIPRSNSTLASTAFLDDSSRLELELKTVRHITANIASRLLEDSH